MSLTLLTLRPQHIVDYITRHPIDWSSKRLARRGGPGDRAGRPPTPAVEEFLRLLKLRGGLFTQEAFYAHLATVWRPWLSSKPDLQQNGIRAKAYRNFYPSMIDSLHVWSMLCAAGWFDVCSIDSREDAKRKTDLILVRDDTILRVGLRGPTSAATRAMRYKKLRRAGTARGVIDVPMCLDWPASPGNKRWFSLDSFRFLLELLPQP